MRPAWVRWPRWRIYISCHLGLTAPPLHERQPRKGNLPFAKAGCTPLHGHAHDPMNESGPGYSPGPFHFFPARPCCAGIRPPGGAAAARRPAPPSPLAKKPRPPEKITPPPQTFGLFRARLCNRTAGAKGCRIQPWRGESGGTVCCAGCNGLQGCARSLHSKGGWDGE